LRWAAIRDGIFCHNYDNHNAFSHTGLWCDRPDLGIKGLQSLIFGDRLLRRSGVGLTSGDNVSGDCVVFWALGYSLLSDAHKPVDHLKRIAKHYLKHLGVMSDQGYVSARCNNFGANYCPDSTLWRCGGPAAYPQVLTSSCLFALAARDIGGIWRAIFWCHWLLFGMWYFAFMPFPHPKNDGLGAARDVSIKALAVLSHVFGNRWWIKRPLKFFWDISPSYNPGICAAIGYSVGVEILPEIVSPWVSQDLNGVNNPSSDSSASVYCRAMFETMLEKAKVIFGSSIA
jgi:hypothetical protein